MNELETQHPRQYVSSKDAAKLYGVTHDYITLLCRRGKLHGVRERTHWLVECDSLEAFFSGSRKENTHALESIRTYHLQDATSSAAESPQPPQTVVARTTPGRLRSVATGVVTSGLLLLVIGGTYALSSTRQFDVAPHTQTAAAFARELESPFFLSPGWLGDVLTRAYHAFTNTTTRVDTIVQAPTQDARQERQEESESPAAVTVVEQHNTYPVVERVVERVTAEAGVSQQLLDTRLVTLGALLRDEWRRQVDGIFDVIERSESGGGISTITDADVPDTITASNYLPLAGGTLTGALNNSSSATSTFSGPLSVERLEIATTTSTSTIVGGLSTTRLEVLASSTLAGLQLTGLDCSGFNNSGKLTTDTSGNVICGNDTSGSGVGTPGGGDTQVQFNDSGDFGADAAFTYDHATDLLTVPYASTTAITASGSASTTALIASGSFTLGSDTAFTSLLGSGLQNSGGTLTLDASGDWTGTLDGADGSHYLANSFATTSADYWETEQFRWATTSAAYFLSQNQGSAFSTTSALYHLGTLDKGFFFSTTSADYWESQQSRWATTSSDYWLTQQTTDDLAQGAVNRYYDDALVNAYVHGSSTIPKTYTANTWSSLQTLTGGLTTDALALGFLNGPLQANAGVVSATTSIGVLYGGTGLTSAPSYGELLLGNSSGGYTLTATSSLGLPTFSTLDSYLTQATFFSSTSPEHITGLPNLSITESQISDLDHYTDDDANAFIAASTTIPKTYTANAFTALQQFGAGASSTLLSANQADFGATATSSFDAAGNLTLGGTLTGAGLVSCSGSTQKLLWDGGTFSCGTDLNTGGGGDSDVNWTFFNGAGLFPSTTTNQVVIGASSTSTLSQLEVVGGATIDYGSTTAVTVSGTGYFGTASTTNLRVSGTQTFEDLASSGLAVDASGAVYAAATTTFSGALVYSNGNVTLDASGDWTGTLDGQEGSYYLANSFSTTSALYHLSTIDKGYFFSTTSADYWKTQNNFFSTTSAEYFASAFRDWSIQSGALSPTTTLGIGIFASSTIGSGAAAGGLTISGNATTTGNLIVLGTGTSTFAGDIGISGDIVPALDNTYSLGSSAFAWKDVFIGPGSLYVNGQQVVSTDGFDNVVISSDPNENIVVETSGTANIELNPTGSGQILLKSGINVTAGKNLTTTDSSALDIPFGVAAGNLTVSGNAITATNLNGGISITPNGNGGTYITAGNLGIGNTNPQEKLNVQGEIAGQFFTATSSSISTFPNLTATAATTTGFAVTGVASSLLKTNGLGQLTAAVAGSDYLSAAITEIGPAGQTADGSAVTLATSTGTFSGLTSALTITASGDVITFTPSLSGVLTAGGGGTSISNPTAAGILLGSYAGGGWQQLATSSLGIALSDTTGTLAVTRGGTGLSSAPSYGQVLLGNASGTYDLVATSSLGITGSGSSGGNVPAGTIAAFEATSCPTGWSEYEAARGMFLRGIDNGAGIDPDGTRTPGDVQQDAAPNITGTFNQALFGSGMSVSGAFSQVTAGNLHDQTAADGIARNITFNASNSNATYGAADEIRPVNVAVLYCQASGSVALEDGSIVSGLAGQLPYYAADGTSLSATSTLFLSPSRNVGVGTTSPWAKFSVHAQDGDTNTTLFAIASSTASATTTLFTINRSGYVGIGSSSPQAPVSINGTSNVGPGNVAILFEGPSHYVAGTYSNGEIVRFFGTTGSNSIFLGAIDNVAGQGAVQIYEDGSAAITISGGVASGDFNDTSDARLKTNIQSLSSENGLAALMRLNPISFNWVAGQQEDRTYLGFTAQEVQEVFPDLVVNTGVVSSTTPGGTLSLKYIGLIAPMVQAIQELNLNLEAVASTTASSTSQSQSFASAFFANLFTRITIWLADAGNGIANLFADTITATNINAESVTAKRLKGDLLCVDDICVTRDQFAAVFGVAANDNPAHSTTTPQEPADAPTEATTTPQTDGDPSFGATEGEQQMAQQQSASSTEMSEETEPGTGNQGESETEVEGEAEQIDRAAVETPDETETSEEPETTTVEAEDPAEEPEAETAEELLPAA